MQRKLNNKGYALVLVIVVLAVLSILSVAALHVTTTESKLSIENKEELNSYTLAKTGLEVVSKRLIANPTEISTLLSSGNALSTNIGSGSFSVTLTGNINNTVKLNSLGSFNGNTQNLYLEMRNVANPIGIFENAVYSNNDLDFDNNTVVNGDVQSGGSIDLPKDYDDVATENSPIIYPTFIIPTTVINKGNVTIGNGAGNVDSFSITETNWSYGNLDIDNGKTLTLGTVGSTTPINVIVDSLTVKGSIVVNSKVNLFVKNTLDLQTSGYVNTSGLPSNLYIYLGTSNTSNQDDPTVNNGTHPEDLIDGFNPNGVFNIQAGQVIKAYVYAPASYISTDSGNVVIEGGVICNLFDDKNNAEITFVAPSSDDDIFDGVLLIMNKHKYVDN